MTIWIGIKDGALLGIIDDYVLLSSKKDSSQKFFCRVDAFGLHQKGEYGFCDEHCFGKKSSKATENGERMIINEDKDDPVVFEEELPIILNNPL